MTERKKIAILGGGPAAISTAFWLTEKPSWRDEYEITVYQMGWRLGGKCASGRNMQDGYGKRIEEHGLHMFFGCYENAFYTLRRVYQALGEMSPPPVHTFRDWTTAFRPHHSAFLADQVHDQWFEWDFFLRDRPGTPGSGFGSLPWDLFMELLAALREAYQDYITRYILPRTWAAAITERLPTWVRPAFHAAMRFCDAAPLWRAFGSSSSSNAPRAAALGTVLDPHWASHDFLRSLVAKHLTPELGEEIASAARTFEEALLHRLEAFARALPIDPGRHDLRVHDLLADGLAEFMRLVRDGLALLPETEDTVRLAFVIDLAGTTLLGILRDRVLVRGFEALDDHDFRDWLRSYGALRQTLDSRALFAWYDMAFAYDRGDASRPNAATGTAMLGMMRLLFGYKGAFRYKMQAGMGDTIFTPLYGVLVERGVRFEFFHRVDRLALDPDDLGQVGEIHLTRQARLRPEREALGYWPLVPVKELDCWPSEPDLSQLRDGDRFGTEPGYPHFFESNWYEWPESSRVVLRRGEHFDHIVLGIALPALPRICEELTRTDARWQRMLHGDGVHPGVGSVRTLGLQLWFKRRMQDPPPHGRHHVHSPLTSGYAEPFDTWADMNQLLPVEDWPPDGSAAAITYCCGMLPDPPGAFPCHDPLYQSQQDERLCGDARRWLAKNWQGIAPYFVPGARLEDLLVDPGGPGPGDAFDHQFFRANVDPSERYVGILAGTTKFRLRTDESGCRNLTLTGDWIRNPVLSAGFAEGAIAAGMAAARSICGHPRRIFGESSPGRPRE